jgi:hypothetical protein
MRWTLATASVMALASHARAGDNSTEPGPPRGIVDLQFAVSVRHAEQETPALSAPFNGTGGTPVRILASYFFGRSGFGLAGGLDVEHYGLYSPVGAVGPDGKTVNLSMTGLRGSVAVCGRVALPAGLSVQGRAGYAFQMVPVVAIDSNSNAATASSIQHSSPLLAALVAWDPSPGFSASAGAQWLPVSIGGSSPNGPVNASAFTLGGEMALGSFAFLGARGRALVTYEYSSFRAIGSQLTFTERDHRFGVGARAAFGGDEAPVAKGPPTGPGTVRGTVSFDNAPTPASGVDVEVVGAGSVQTDINGAFVIPMVGPGTLTVRAHAPQCRVAEATLTVPPQTDVTTALTLHRLSGPGRIRGMVFEVAEGTDGRRPVGGAKVVARGAEVVSEADGSFQMESVGPGPVSVQVTTKEHKPASEVVAVPPEAEATIVILLQKSGTRRLATIKGHVRSVSGMPVRAILQIPEANSRVSAETDGGFAVRLPGGRYTVKIEAPGFVSQLRTVDVADGDQAIFNVDLKPAAQ